MSRIVQAELLDSLPHDHPAARQNRRDLRLTNWIMGNHRWLIRSVPRHIRPGERLLELGAGDGELARRLQRRGRLVDALDLCPAPATWPAAADWHRVKQYCLGALTRVAVRFAPRPREPDAVV